MSTGWRLQRGWRWAALGALMLAGAGCMAPDAGQGPAVFRNQDAPIGSTTRFSAPDLVGQWRVVARFATSADAAGSMPETLRFSSGNAGGLQLQRQFYTCNSFECVHHDETMTARMVAPGRVHIQPGLGDADTMWILWGDADARILVIGEPKGRFGWIMARAPIRQDLHRAAREILTWSGYDLTHLNEVKP